MGFQNITEAGGIGLALTGMTIVFFALVLVTSFIAVLPRALPFVNSILPVVEGHHGASKPPTPSGSQTATDEDLIAAIGFALHVRRSE